MTDDNNRNMEKENKKEKMSWFAIFQCGGCAVLSQGKCRLITIVEVNSIVSFVFCNNLFAFTMLKMPKNSIFIEILGSF